MTEYGPRLPPNPRPAPPWPVFTGTEREQRRKRIVWRALGPARGDRLASRSTLATTGCTTPWSTR